MTSSERSLCVITARGGSKRIPRKNIKDFLGKPIIAYSIDAALRSGLFDEVMVSTDDEEIAEVARAYGASVPFMRSSATSGDYATTSDVLIEVLNEYRRRGETFETICCVYPTAPFVTPKELKDAYTLLEDSKAPSVIPVTGFDFPPQRAFSIDDEGRIAYANPEYARIRSQDLPLLVHDCGRFSFVRTSIFEATASLVMEDTRGLYIPENLVQDIDTVEDWELAEIKYSRAFGGGADTKEGRWGRAFPN